MKEEIIMLTIFIKVRKAYLIYMYEYYRARFDAAYDEWRKALKESDENDIQCWEKECLNCIDKRQEAYDKIMKLRGY